MKGIEDWKRYYREEYPRFWITQSQEYEKDCYSQIYYAILLNSIGAKPGQHVLDCGVGTGKPFTFAFWYVSGLKKALTEMYRVTKPGGKIVFDVTTSFAIP